MAKRRKPEKKPQKQLAIYKRLPVVITNTPISSPNATLSEDDEESAVSGNAVQINFLAALQTDSTAAPRMGEDEEKEEEDSISKTKWQFLEKFLSDKLQLKRTTLFKLTCVLWVLSIAVVFVQDNSNGKIDNPNGMQWFLTKAIYITAFCVIIELLIGFSWCVTCIFSAIRERVKSKPKSILVPK